MKIALIGYGKMGKMIEQIAISRGHEIVSIIDIDNLQDFESEAFASADVAIEFTSPTTAYDNIRACIEAGVAVLSGSTGWMERKAEIDALCRQKGGAFFYSSNYSVGVNILFRLNRWLAGVMGNMPQYNVEIEEIHHIHKLDAPSGTAATLAEDMKEASGGRIVVAKEDIVSVREGEVPGTHTITYDSPEDTLTVSHRAKSRRGLAVGAVLAAEWLVGRTGIFTMDDFLKI